MAYEANRKVGVFQVFPGKGIWYSKKPTGIAVIKGFQENLGSILGGWHIAAVST
jgi:hypothetical protein